MTDTTRKSILEKLEKISELAPEIRFGQLVANMAFLAAGPRDETLWNLEDAQLLVALEQHLADLNSRQQTVA